MVQHLSRSTLPTRSPRAGSELRRITVVDDNDEFIEVLADVFAARFRVTGTSHESINAIADTRPDLLIVDLEPASGMGLNAWELVGLARRHRELRHVPVIVCTTDVISLRSDGERLAAHDQVHLVAKPFTLEIIEGLVGRLVQGETPLGHGVAV